MNGEAWEKERRLSTCLLYTSENGVYMRMGYVYVVVIAAAALGSMLYGNDPSSACLLYTS